VIVDCLTVWVGNLFHHRPEPVGPRPRVRAAARRARRRTDPTVVVSNEVGLGLHPDTSLGREYRDELGRLNQRVAAAADVAPCSWWPAEHCHWSIPWEVLP
jgi:adenosylcobinamide kinase/adenosylcobinamide-phosphate guanylyltransferase